MAERIDTGALDRQVDALRKRGVALPRNPLRAAQTAADLHGMSASARRMASNYGFQVVPGERMQEPQGRNNRIAQSNSDMIAQMRANRMTRTASAGGGDIIGSTPRFYDPMEFWDLSGLPWNMADEGHRHKLHKWLRLFYATHYLVPILIDIFTRFPLVGMSLESKDKSLTSFYEDQFLETLNYPEYLVQLGREYWTVGESFALGSFDEDLGIWEREELLNPEDITVENFPILGSQQLKVVPPDHLKKLVQQKAPAKEYKMLEQNFPELIPYLRKNEHIPMSGVVLKQVANKITAWDDHGTPILLRGLRTLMHEEKLMASQDAIAERLYSPMILAKLGIMDMGDGQPPYFPSADDLDAFRDDLDIALSSDFRVMVHHMGLEMENVFGREQMPRLGDDFDRIERRIMQIFGVNPSLLSAGSNSQPYASSALQAEFLNQILRTFQGYLKRHYQSRAEVVAEAQGHYDYEVRGQTRIPIKEEVVVYDEEGNKRIETRNKLLIPDLEFQTLDLRDEATERQFLQTLRSMGVPIPDQKLMVGIDRDIDDLVDEFNEELVKKTTKQQEAKVKTYSILETAGLPIPPDLAAEVMSTMQPQPGAGGAPGGAGGLPGMPSGMGGPGGPAGPGGPGGGPGEAIMMPPPPGGLQPPGLGPAGPGGSVPGGGPPARGPETPNPNVPAVSMERRPGMPTANVKSSSEDDTVENESENDQQKDESQDATVISLPRAKDTDDSKFGQRKSKKYTIIDSDAEPISDDTDSQSESS